MKIKIAPMVLMLFQSVAAFSQSGFSFDSLLTRLTQYNNNYAAQKIHMQFDKPLYTTGDTIWFAAYVVNAQQNIPSDKSSFIYIDLLDGTQTVRRHLQVPLTVGFGAGEIALADSLEAGAYRIRAYTNRMRNFSSDHFFYKSVVITSPRAEPAGLTRSVTVNNPGKQPMQYDIRFFPEGGNLINGIPSATGFRVINSAGTGVDAEGKLYNSSGKEVLSFKTSHAGIGAFRFTPSAKENYTAVVKFLTGEEKRVILPRTLNSGYVITSDNSNKDSLTITLLCSPDLVNKKEMVLMPLSNGYPLFYMKTSFPDQRVNITALRNKLPDGILQWMLFNAEGEPVSERLVFNNYRRQANMIVKGKPDYHKRERTELEINVTDFEGRPLIGSFSVTVLNADAVPVNEQKETTIYSNLLLASDLKGDIEDPDYYLLNDSTERITQRDNLLLTQSRPGLMWQDIREKHYPQLIEAPEPALSVNGTVRNSEEQLAAGITVNLLPAQIGYGSIQSTITDAEGHFAFNLPPEEAGNRFMLQAGEKKDQGYHIELSKPLAPDDILPGAVIPTYGSTAKASQIHDNPPVIARNTMLKEVVVKDYNFKKKSVPSYSTNLNGPGNADYVILGEELEKYPDLSYIRAFAPVKIYGNKRRIDTDMKVLVDGVPGYNLAQISMNEVASIEIMKSSGYTGIYGLNSNNGVILVTTKREAQNDKHNASQANVVYFQPPVHIARDFYSPRYEKGNAYIKTPDLRTTVYWKPDVTTDANGKATIQYYNTDVPGNYRVIIEGVSAKGDLCRTVYTYNVK